MNLAGCTLVLGLGATAVMDAWGIARRPLLSLPRPDYGLVGRWLVHMAHGRFRHDAIAASAPMRGEALVGWSAHYLTGVAFAAVLVGLWGVEWLRHPTLWPALAVGLGSTAAPFLLMQPGMGAGIASARARRPGAARLQTIVTHTVFGLGLYAAGHLVSRLCFD
jgi:hypothetical protein